MKRWRSNAIALLSLLGSAACGQAGSGPSAAVDRCGEECAPRAPGTESADAAAGSLAATLVMDGFDIPPGQEYVRCQRFANPFGRDVVLTRTESLMSTGAHHLFAFLRPNATDGPLEVCSGLDFNDYLHTSQRPHEVYAYPSGVGRLLRADQGVRLQIHYFNPSAESTRVELAMTLRAAEPEQIPIRAGQIFINTYSINVAPNSPGSAGARCTVPKNVQLFSAISHMHKYGVHFVARDSNQQLLYETNDWAHPEPWSFTPPRQLVAGSQIQIGCAYENSSDYPLTFGESAATNEMCIFAGGYYPAEDDEGITCLF